MTRLSLLFRPLPKHCIAVLLAVLCTPVLANPAAQQYQQVCASCHGPAAQGVSALGGPALAGQNAQYLVRQIENFKTGKRGAHPSDTYGQQMVAISNTLTQPDKIAELASYLSTLAVAEQPAADGDVKNGYRYYQSCGSCHGAQAEGNPAFSAPRLAGLSAQYLLRQHNNFNNGLRGAHPDDRYGRQMAMMASTVKDESVLRDIIAYINSIAP